MIEAETVEQLPMDQLRQGSHFARLHFRTDVEQWDVNVSEGLHGIMTDLSVGGREEPSIVHRRFLSLANLVRSRFRGGRHMQSQLHLSVPSFVPRYPCNLIGSRAFDARIPEGLTSFVDNHILHMAI